MGASVAAATAVGTLLGLMARKGHGKMAVLVSYLWLCITTSVAFFIRFLAGAVFRPKREEEKHQHGSCVSVPARPPVPIAEVSKPPEEEEGEEGEKKETHVFQFKFSFQIPEQSIDSRGLQEGSAGEDGGSSMVASVSNYRFVSERDRRGFVEAPQAMTLRVQESYVDSDGFVRSSPEELDGELNSKLSPVKHIRRVDANITAARELDRELKNGLLSVKFSRLYASDDGAAVHEEERECMSLNPCRQRRTDVSQELELLDDRLSDEADSPVDDWQFPLPAGDFSEFDSETTSSESRSDGYSVKDLIVDSHSDGFFSERDFEAEVDRARFLDLDGKGEVCVEFEQKYKATQLPSSLEYVKAAENFDGEGMELQKNKKNSYIEIKRESLPNSISSLDLHDVVSDGIIQSSTVELDRVLKSRFSLVKSSQRDDSDIGVAGELDRELKSRLLMVKFSREHKTLYHDNLSRGDVSKESKLLDIWLPDEADVLAGGRLFSVPAGDIGGFNLDSESESKSDGYSVKDLIVDFDSDGLFSEKDFEAEVDKASSLDLDGKEENYVELEQKSRTTHLPNSLHSIGGSKDFDGDDTELLENVNNCKKLKWKNLPNSISSSGIHDDVAESDLCVAELEADHLHQGEIDQKEAINDSNNTDEVSSITSLVGLDMEHLVEDQPKIILSKSGQGGADQFGVEESESLESREPDGIKLSKPCGLDKESVDFGIKNQNMNNPNLSNQVLSEALATSDSEPDHVNGEEAGDVAVAGENSDELEQGLVSPHDSEEPHLHDNSGELSMEDMEELESLWEHDDLIDQLKMDLKKARATGLPTILEESESPKPAEGLKPWKPEARFLHEDPVEEVHKFYKSYRDRMRKLDVLDRQKMYAIGFLQLKDPLQSKGTQKPIIPTIASVLSQNFWRRKSCTDPSEKFIKEVQSDLEMVCVGQSCLSWEFLRWQYERTHELLGSDPHDSRQYNQVAEEFQQFQVLIQRFLENEPFQGPRVTNYAKSRCVLRRILQVPVVREDCFKDKADERRKWKDGITGEQLEYIMEESIRIFWDFVKSDKDETSLIMKGLFGTHVELQDPTDFDFMVDIQANLKQKQKKLKDILRTGNCLVKKFKKPQPGRSNQDDLFFSQVDLKLVSKVLKMTRITTDQLVWCHKKLSKISFVDRKLLREPSFLLFPC